MVASSFFERVDTAYFNMGGHTQRLTLHADAVALMRWMPLVSSLQVLASFMPFVGVQTWLKGGLAAALVALTTICAAVGTYGAVGLKRWLMLLHFFYGVCVMIACGVVGVVLVYSGKTSSIALPLLVIGYAAQIPALYLLRRLTAYADEMEFAGHSHCASEVAPLLVYPVIANQGDALANAHHVIYTTMPPPLARTLTPADMQASVSGIPAAARQEAAAHAQYHARCMAVQQQQQQQQQQQMHVMMTSPHAYTLAGYSMPHGNVPQMPIYAQVDPTAYGTLSAEADDATAGM